MIIVILGYIGIGRDRARCRRQGSPLRVSIVIDSLFTKNMHNEFIIAYRACYVASPQAHLSNAPSNSLQIRTCLQFIQN